MTSLKYRHRYPPIFDKVCSLNDKMNENLDHLNLARISLMCHIK